MLDELVLIKKYRFPGEDYAGSDQMTGIFFSNGQFAELEPCSPTFPLRPGQSITFTERWELALHAAGWSP